MSEELETRCERLEGRVTDLNKVLDNTWGRVKAFRDDHLELSSKVRELQSFKDAVKFTLIVIGILISTTYFAFSLSALITVYGGGE